MASRHPQQPGRASQLLADIEVQSRNRDFGGFSNTITQCLSPPNVIHEVAAAPEFWYSAEELVTTVSADNDHAIAFALAEVGRLMASLKSKSNLLRPMAAALLTKRTPPHFCFGDADQTAFAARGWAGSGRPVDLAVATRTVATADAPKPLVPWLELALSAGDVSDVIEHIASVLVELSVSNAESPKNRSSRLQRLLKALRSALDADRFNVDKRAPAALTVLVARAFRGIQRPIQYAPSAKAVDELMSLALHMIRMDLRLLTESAIYDSMDRASGWLPDGGWLRYTKSSAGAAKLRKILLDGLVILLKQNSPNRALLDSHRMLSPNRQAALVELKAVAEADREIPANQRVWLASGGEKSVVRAEREMTETDDLAIAMALLAAEALARCEPVANSESGDTEAGGFVHHALEVRDRVQSVARRRDLQLFGELGDVVKFSPNAHRLATPDAAPDHVRIIEPGVESRGSFGARVVVPALAIVC